MNKTTSIYTLLKSFDINLTNTLYGNSIETQKLIEQHDAILNETIPYLSNSTKYNFTDLSASLGSSFNKLSSYIASQLTHKIYQPIKFGLSNLNLIDEWCVPATESTISDGLLEFSSILIKENFEIYLPTGWQSPIIKITTKSGNTVYIKLNHPYNSESTYFTLLDAFFDIKINIDNGSYQDMTDQYSSINIPKININTVLPLNWIAGINDGYFQISDAIQQNKLTIDGSGFKLSSIMATCINSVANQVAELPSLSVITPSQNDNSSSTSFLLWVESPSCTYPMFGTYIISNDCLIM